MKKLWLVLFIIAMPLHGMEWAKKQIWGETQLSPIEQVRHTLAIDQELMKDLVNRMDEEQEISISNLTKQALIGIQATEEDEKWGKLTWVHQRVEQVTNIENPTEGDRAVCVAVQKCVTTYQNKLYNPLYIGKLVAKRNPEAAIGAGILACSAATICCLGPLINICCFPTGSIISYAGCLPAIGGFGLVVDSYDKTQEIILHDIVGEKAKFDELAAMFEKEKED